MEKKLYFEPEIEIVELQLSGEVLLAVSGEDEGEDVELGGGEGSQDDFPRQ